MLETVAVAVHLQDVNVVGEPVKQSAGEPLGAEHVFSSHSLLTVRQRSRILWPNAPRLTPPTPSLSAGRLKSFRLKGDAAARQGNKGPEKQIGKDDVAAGAAGAAAGAGLGGLGGAGPAICGGAIAIPAVAVVAVPAVAVGAVAFGAWKVAKAFRKKSR